MADFRRKSWIFAIARTDPDCLKRPIAILLLLPLCYTQFGYYGAFIIRRWRMQEAAREARIAALPDGVMQRISLAGIQTQGRWEEEGKECWYKGHLYDVIRQRIQGGTTWLFCLDDEREERLIHGSVDVTGANQDQPDKRAGQTLTISIVDLLCETPVWIIEPLTAVIKQYAPARAHRLPSRYERIITPPPKYPPVLFC